jgi:hypothetical protein
MMLTINIDNPELEQSIHQTYDSNKQSIVKGFMEFIQQQKIKKDIGTSIQQLDAGECMPMEDVFSKITAKYE